MHVCEDSRCRLLTGTRAQAAGSVNRGLWVVFRKGLRQDKGGPGHSRGVLPTVPRSISAPPTPPAPQPASNSTSVAREPTHVNGQQPPACHPTGATSLPLPRATMTGDMPGEDRLPSTAGSTPGTGLSLPGPPLPSVPNTRNRTSSPRSQLPLPWMARGTLSCHPVTQGPRDMSP